MITPSGFLRSDHKPVDGKPESSTLPVGVLQVGCVMVPITGAGSNGGGELITTVAGTREEQPEDLATLNVYVPGNNPDIVVLLPLPVVSMAPGLRVIVQDPEGKLPSTTLPVLTVQVGWMMFSTDGVGGWEFTVSVYVAVAGVHGNPSGLLVVKVIITVSPASLTPGVYVKEKGEVAVDDGVTVPVPFSVIVTPVALPPNTFPFTVTGVSVPQTELL